MKRFTITTCKKVLRECLLTLEAVERLLFLGVKSVEVNFLIVNSISDLNLDWLDTWIKAHAHVYNRGYSYAVITLRTLDNVVLLRDNFNLLSTMGKWHYYADDKNAFMPPKWKLVSQKITCCHRCFASCYSKRKLLISCRQCNSNRSLDRSIIIERLKEWIAARRERLLDLQIRVWSHQHYTNTKLPSSTSTIEHAQSLSCNVY